ncbi:hypothetical protein [Nocardia suismassiliense]|uniref:hypothetical protein n=1 Tax=Nocardia suismassiliense TaxID=2077092 RepID=UPI00131F400F|nr:hypothetical protein [Nocardia suismassiliense]
MTQYQYAAVAADDVFQVPSAAGPAASTAARAFAPRLGAQARSAIDTGSVLERAYAVPTGGAGPLDPFPGSGGSNLPAVSGSRALATIPADPALDPAPVVRHTSNARSYVVAAAIAAGVVVAAVVTATRPAETPSDGPAPGQSQVATPPPAPAPAPAPKQPVPCYPFQSGC